MSTVAGRQVMHAPWLAFCPSTKTHLTWLAVNSLHSTKSVLPSSCTRRCFLEPPLCRHDLGIVLWYKYGAPHTSISATTPHAGFLRAARGQGRRARLTRSLMDDILTEGDFDDFAAAVGEGGDGSDEDASVRRTQYITLRAHSQTARPYSILLLSAASRPLVAG